MTVRFLLQATVVVRAPLGSTPSHGSDRLAPQLVVASAPPVTNHANLYRYGIQLMPDRRIVILPAPPMSATVPPPPPPSAPAAVRDEEGGDDDDDDHQDGSNNNSVAAITPPPRPHAPGPAAPSIPIEAAIQSGPIPMPIDTSRRMEEIARVE